MAVLFYKDENGTFQPIGVKLLGKLSGGKTYMHIIRGDAYYESDNDIGGTFTIVVTSSSDAKITEPSTGGTAIDGIVGFLKKIEAEGRYNYYPITFDTDGYTSCNWVGMYYNEKIYFVNNNSSNMRIYPCDLSSITEKVIEM